MLAVFIVAQYISGVAMLAINKINLVLDHYNISPNKETARSYIFDCPVCEAKNKLYLEKRTGRAICFRHRLDDCPTVKTPLYRVLSLIAGVPVSEIESFFKKDISITAEEPIPDLDEIADSSSLQLINDDAPLVPLTPLDWPRDSIPLDWQAAEEGVKYLLGRGLDIEHLIEMGVKYSLGMKRVVFPVTHYDNTYGWQARTIYPNVEPRMYNYPGTWKSKTLMFFNNILTSEHVILAEGAVSALKFKMAGGFVASMGKLVSKEQIKLILQPNIKKVYLALDSDAINEMVDLAKSIMRLTNNTVECYFVKVPRHKEDFGDCTYEECLEAFNSAEPIDTDCFSLYSYMMEIV